MTPGLAVPEAMPLPSARLRLRIAALILLGLLPAFILVVANQILERDRAIAATYDLTKRLARLAAAKEGALIEGAHQLTIALSVLPAVVHRDAIACNTYARQLLSAYPQYTNFGVVELDGSVWCSSAPIKTSANLGDRPYVRHAIEEGKSVLGEYQVGRLTGLPSIAFASPIRGARGTVEGVAIASMLASAFGTLGRELDMPEDAIYAIVDHDGRLLRRFPEEQFALGMDLSGTEPFRASRNSLSGSMEAVGLDGVTRLYGYAWSSPDREQSILVVVGLSKDRAVAPANRAMSIGLLALLGVATLTIVLASIASQTLILNPVNRLLEAARRIAAGDLHFRANINETGELGELGRAVDNMAASLEREQKALKDSEARFKDLTELSSDWYWEQDELFRFTELSEEVASKAGITAPSHIGKTRWELPGINMSQGEWDRHIAVLEAHEPFENFVYERAGPDGGMRYLSMSGRPIFDAQGTFKGYRGVGKDVTATRAAEARIAYLAYHDVLTTLPNRASFSLILNHGISHAHRQKTGLALLFIDLDGFKTINDTLGHEAGDRLLQEIGKRLKGCVRQNDTVARIGGDEFVALLTDVAAPEHVAGVAEKILSEIAGSSSVLAGKIRVTASAGIALYPQDGENEQTLMKNADSAMYRAKQQGKNNFEFHNPTAPNVARI